MSKETPDEMFERVQMMAGGNPAWDLSENDIAALNHVLSTLHDVASEADPAGTLRELRQAQETIRALEIENAELKARLTNGNM